MTAKIKSLFKQAMEAIGTKILVGLGMLILGGFGYFLLSTEKSIVNNAVAGTQTMADTRAAIDAISKQATVANAAASVANTKVDQVISKQEQQGEIQKRMFDTLKKQGEAYQTSTQAILISLAEGRATMSGVQAQLKRVEDNQDRQIRGK